MNEVKVLCDLPKEAFQWIELGSGYQMVPITSEYGGIKQRWQLIYSEQACVREKKSLLWCIDKEAIVLKKDLWYLGNQVFGLGVSV